MDKDTISVVVPVYNSEKYIAECLDSVINQTTKPYEIIVCDDASTDGTQDVVMRYVKKYPELFKKLFHRSNIGISANYNSGLTEVDGKYVTMVAGDDYWLPRKLELEIHAIKAKRTKWAYSKVMLLFDDSGLQKTFPGTEKDLEGNVFKNIFAREIRPRNFLIEYDALKRVGFFDEQFEIYEDWDLKIRLAKEYEIAYVPEYSLVYRSHEEGVSQSDPLVHMTGMRRVYEKNKNLLGTLPLAEQMNILEVIFKANARQYERECIQYFDKQNEKQIREGTLHLPDLSKDYKLFVAKSFKVLKLEREAALRQREKEYSAQISNLKKELSNIKNSWSWKLSWPVRMVGRILRFVRKKN